MKAGLTRMRRPRRTSREPVVPMINVVFLLLIFFLMTAQIVPPAPFDITLPTAGGEDDAARDTLYLGADGTMAFADARGDAALAAAVAASEQSPLRVLADAQLDAATLARTLASLTALGATAIDLVTEGG
ncbi:biopolymer transporter ExbD [Marivita sp. S6314]|uniref:ExbD/TolR family protein n=1 Tax=Marivita sp. S6314 TaxID=2926406 RepID=UPI001FF41544|nr:biopolymer transporter ExbD [Marivita sp. S6314]MCK0149078.1 biopolymer transporter ExbD [Marivita sp. S6314]